MPGRLTFFRAGGRLYAQGLGASVHENAPAFGFSVMITASFGAVAALSARPEVGEIFLFAFGAVAGFTAVALASRLADDGEEGELERVDVVVVASLLNVLSVLAAVGAAAGVAWLGGGWWPWLAAPLAATATYALANGLEYAVAREEEGG